MLAEFGNDMISHEFQMQHEEEYVRNDDDGFPSLTCVCSRQWDAPNQEDNNFQHIGYETWAI